ncbi:hypothetical protein DPMN_062838 [Dreissena polymorpha]|uniref:Uncharacterized protein n=1 Tax=Dreissena polymorpha TaxID=45954 RepID=A0A9D4CAI1_DREPO|nr:hypothetical protein DPMN_062838 [Dreissena polymorpha]
MSSGALMCEASSKMIGTLNSILHCGFNPVELTPITLRKIYVNVVLPKALYGSPLWCNYSNSDIIQLEVSHRRCVKQFLHVGRNTNTDVALSYLNIDSVEELIDFEKLEYFGQLCRLSVRFLAKKVFIHRLVRYCLGCVNMQGLISDIYRLLQKYSLMPALETYLESGVFPERCHGNGHSKTVLEWQTDKDAHKMQIKLHASRTQSYLKLIDRLQPSSFLRLHLHSL